MSFPVSPVNGQQSTIANIVYQYASATNAWTIVPGYANVISATGTISSDANISGANLVATSNVVTVGVSASEIGRAHV